MIAQQGDDRETFLDVTAVRAADICNPYQSILAKA
jgi:hypothetical protein